MQTAITDTVHALQAAQLYTIGNEKASAQVIMPFRDDHDHLQALELEANMLIASSYFRSTGYSKTESEDNKVRDICSVLQLSEEDIDPDRMTERMNSLQEKNRMREAVSAGGGINLMFNELCSMHGLCEFERKVLMILLMLYSNKGFRKIIELCGYEEERREDSLGIGTLISIVCNDFRDQLSSRFYFSLDGKLVSEELIVFLGYIDDKTNILDERVCIHERTARYLIGDNNIYNTMFTYICRERSNVRLEQVVMPDRIKEDILVHMGNFLKKKQEKKNFLDEFFGYGTGLVFFFHGSSGTGKTMLAKGLANHFHCQIFSLSAKNLNNIPGSYEEIFGTLFREASLQNGMVFFDEADDLFEPDSFISRAMLIEIEKSRCITIFSTNKAVDLDPALERRISMKIYFPFPGEAVRRELWERLIPGNVEQSDDVDLNDLAARYLFTGGIIKNTIFLALNALVNGNGGERPLLTMSSLVHAADIQAERMFDDSHICRTITPQAELAELPLADEQKRELYGVARAFAKLKKEKLGFNMLICSSDIETGRRAVQGLAMECGLKVREFNYYNIVTNHKDNKVLDQISQREITPLEYAFSMTTGDPLMTVFLDYGGYFSERLKSNNDDNYSEQTQSVLGQLRHNEHLFCMVTLPMRAHRIPVEFNLAMEIKCPPTEMQMNIWRQNLGKDRVSDADLMAIIGEYPMHFTEIEFISRQALIQSIVRSKEDGYGIGEIMEVISRYRKRKPVNRLFGAGD